MQHTSQPPELIDFAAGYTSTAWEASRPDDPEAPWSDRFSEAARLHMAADCGAFLHAHRAELTEACNRVGYSWTQAGGDFWLTRNGAGVGYWDRDQLDEGDLGRRLSDACRDHPAELELGDDGMLHYLSDWPAAQR
jgi:hypothetical protein